MSPLVTRRSAWRALAAGVAAVSLFACTRQVEFDHGDPPPSVTDFSGRYGFAEVSEETGATREPTRTWGAAWADFDSNGYPDLFVNRHKSGPDLFVNDGGTFTPLDPTWTVAMDRHSCAWGDATHDRRFDLYCTRGARQGTSAGPNHLLVQTDDGFDEQAAAYGVQDPLGRGRTVNWFDYDGDEDIDLFVGNKKRPGHSFALLRNDENIFTPAKSGLAGIRSAIGSSWSDWDVDGDPDLVVLQYPDYPALAFENVDGHFVQATVPRLAAQPWLGAAWGDYDGDGWPDLHLVGPDSSLLLHNVRGRLRVVERIPVREGRMSVWFDVENDGDLDLFIAQGAEGSDPSDALNNEDLLYIQSQTGFEHVSPISVLRTEPNGDADGAAAADYDRDGRVDIFITNGYRQWSGSYELLRNLSRAKNWVGLRIQGDAINPYGLGATVEVEAGSLAYSHLLTDGVNFRSQSEIGYVHLGIADNDSADIRIEWADGTSDCLEAQANRAVDAIKGASPCI